MTLTELVYQDRFSTSHGAADVPALAEKTNASIAGRVMLWRRFGGLIFGHVQDRSGSVQISVRRDVVGSEAFALALASIKAGDFVGVEGVRWTTGKGEPTLDASRIELLASAQRPLPDKWSGISDPETRLRKRYLDLLTNEATRRRFQLRSKLISRIRAFLDDHDFLEVETPVLQNAASGAAARPFETHHNALDEKLYLRISPETYLKRVVAGSFERVYEIGKNFRNEGLDASHLQEFTMLEWYVGYWNYVDNMTFVDELFKNLLDKVIGTRVVEYQGVTLDFSAPFPVIDFREAFAAHTRLDLCVLDSFESLKQCARVEHPSFPVDEYPSYASLVDALYKKLMRPMLVQPTFVVRQPAELVPLARRSDQDGRVLDMFQLVVNGWEIVKGYSELIDPIEQRTRLEEQLVMREAGDEETMMLEEDFLECMEHGMPPMSGVGIGLDRVIALFTDTPTLRNTVLFPPTRSTNK